jgi:site-specific DNA-cytosine methylase
MNDYPAILDQAWQDHLAPRAVDAPTVVSLFAGCGGSSLGYSMAGFRELLAVEWDDHAAGCLRRNFPHTTVIHADVATVDPGVSGLPDVGLLTEINNRHALLAPHVAPGERGLNVLTRSGRKPSYYGLRRFAWDAPGWTVTKSHRAQFLHPRYNRVLGHRELCRVQSFPDDYDWADSTYEQIQARLGNSVPPLLMRAIGRHLRNLLAEAANHPGVDTGR